LFVERAAAAKAGFALTEQNTHAVAQICTRLDGIPLAIELAATRVKALPVEQIAARLDDRFRLLTGGSRTALPRHQTLRALIDWSHSLLSEPERVLLRRLSVFAGGWTLETAEEVASSNEQEASTATTGAFRSPTRSDLPRAAFDLARADVLDLLTRLLEKSLVVAEDLDGEARYRMLETIRQYARDKLLEVGESEPVRQRHLEFFVRLGDLFDASIMGRDDDRWSARLESELDNVRAAMDWSLEHRDALSALRLAGSLRVFWFRRHPGEAIQRVGEILALPEAAARSTARAWALSCYGTLLMFLAQPEKYDAARQAFEESLGIAREVGDERATINALDLLGWTFSAMGTVNDN
jgi:predicted ATPase